MKDLSLARQIRRQKIAEASGSVKASYFGPEVEVGYSYGKYICPECEFEQISNKGEIIHCVNCSSTSNLKEEASFKIVKDMTKKIISNFYCDTCGSVTVTSSKDSKDEVGMFCPQCGCSVEITSDDDEDEEDIEIVEDEDEDEMEDEDEEDIEVIEKEIEPEIEEDEEGEEDDEDEEDEEDEEEIDVIKEDEEPEIEDEEQEIEEEPESVEEEDIEIIEDEDEEPETEETEEEIEVIEPEDEEDIEIVEDEEEDEEDLEESANETEEAKATFEYLTPVEKLPAFSSDEVQMAFCDTSDPSWTVLIKGHPVASINLSDQEKADDIIDLFTSDDYAREIAKAMVKCGAKEVLDQVKARYFVNKIEESELANKLSVKVREELEADYKAKAASLREEFKSSIAVIIAGMNKNFWRDVDDPLKGSLFKKLNDIGVDNPLDMIESAFAESADSYFDIVLEKALDFMQKSPEAREEIAKAITDSNTIISSSTKKIPINDLTKRLEKNNIMASITGGKGISKKESIRKTIKLGKIVI